MLTTTQLANLKAAIDADGTLSAIPNDADGAFAIAALLNAQASPTFYVWRTNYTPDQMRAAMMGGVTQLDALSASKRDSLFWFVQGSVDCSQAGVQAAIDDLCGSQNALKAALLDGGKRACSQAEKILATGTGTLAAPAVAGWQGLLSYHDVLQARAAA